MAKEDLPGGFFLIIGGIAFFAIGLMIYIKTGGEFLINEIVISSMVIGGLFILLGLYRLYEYYQDSTD